MTKYSCVILGEPASKANARRLVQKNGHPLFIKSAKALNYERYFKQQARPLAILLDGELAATIHIYYASQRPDLDESLILDLLQNIAYTNDRQVRERHVYHHIDKLNPRVEIEITKREFN